MSWCMLMNSEDVILTNIAPVRRIALALHSMHEQDRSWFVERLPGSIERPVLEYLNELEELGIEQDQRLAWTILDGLDFVDEFERPAKEKDEGLLLVMRRLDVYTASQVFEVLRHEPVRIVDALLRCHDWSWRNGLLSKYDASTKQFLNGVKEDVSIDGMKESAFPEFTQILLAKFEERLRQNV